MFGLSAGDDAVAVASGDPAIPAVHIHPFKKLIAGAFMVAKIQPFHECRATKISRPCVKNEVQIRSSLENTDWLDYATIECIICRDQICAKPRITILASRLIARLYAMRITLAYRPRSTYVLVGFVSRTLMLCRHRPRNRERDAGKDRCDSGVRGHALTFPGFAQHAELSTSDIRGMPSSTPARRRISQYKSE